MKKLIAIIIAVIAVILLLASCGEKPTKIETKLEPYASSRYHACIEMKSRVLMADSQTNNMYYYSKADGESYVFCFDPLCQHTVQERCVSQLFCNTFSTASQIIYSERNNRIYIVRGQQIYSVSFDASDLRHECSVGEAGVIQREYENEWELYSYDNDYIIDLRQYENFIFFLSKNEETGYWQVYKYNSDTKELNELTAKDEQIIAYEIADGYIFAKGVINGAYSYFVTDFDFADRKYVSYPTRAPGNEYIDVYDGEYFYGCSDKTIFAFNPQTGELKTISTDDSAVQGAIVAVHDGYLYKILSQKSIYRIKISDGMMECVFDWPNTIIKLFNFIEDGVIIEFRYVQFIYIVIVYDHI